MDFIWVKRLNGARLLCDGFCFFLSKYNIKNRYMFLFIESRKFKGPPPALSEFLQIKFWEFPTRKCCGLTRYSIISGK